MENNCKIIDYKSALFDNLKILFGSYFSENDKIQSLPYTNWLYLENPCGPAKIVIVENQLMWIGFMALIPAYFNDKKKKIKVYYVVNVLVHPEHHGKNIFGSMIDVAKKFVNDEGSFMMGHPNSLAIKSWIRTGMKFHNQLLPFLVKPKIIDNELKKIKITDPNQLDSYEFFYNQYNDSNVTLNLSINSKYLRWRFFNNPSVKYNLNILFLGNSVVGIQVTKKVCLGIYMLIDQYILPGYVDKSIKMLPFATIFFANVNFFKTYKSFFIKTPFKKKFDFFFTEFSNKIYSDSYDTVFFSASDF